jgi:hypothetical protein
MRVRPTERGLQHLVDNIEGQIRADLQPTPDRRFRVPEIDPHHEALQLREPGPAQVGASRPCLFFGPGTEARQRASELSKVIELSSADDRIELAQQVSLAVVLAHARTVPLNVRSTAAIRPMVICGYVRAGSDHCGLRSRRSVELADRLDAASLSAHPARRARRTRGEAASGMRSCAGATSGRGSQRCRALGDSALPKIRKALQNDR